MTRAWKSEEVLLKDLSIPPDSVGNFGKGTKVYKSDEGVDYDAYMISVDLKNGFYAEYVFYKLQLLFDSVWDLY